jgi:hypothetical protein
VAPWWSWYHNLFNNNYDKNTKEFNRRTCRDNLTTTNDICVISTDGKIQIKLEENFSIEIIHGHLVLHVIREHFCVLYGKIFPFGLWLHRLQCSTVYSTCMCLFQNCVIFDISDKDLILEHVALVNRAYYIHVTSLVDISLLNIWGHCLGLWVLQCRKWQILWYLNIDRFPDSVSQGQIVSSRMCLLCILLHQYCSISIAILEKSCGHHGMAPILLSSTTVEAHSGIWNLNPLKTEGILRTFEKVI